MNQYQEIVTLVEGYFGALYRGDIVALRAAFHPGATLSGDVNGQAYVKLLEDYLKVVERRQSPESLGERFAMEILSIEILNCIAMVKTRCPMLGFVYGDYLSLVYQRGQDGRCGQWLIASKVFTNIANEK